MIRYLKEEVRQKGSQTIINSDLLEKKYKELKKTLVSLVREKEVKTQELNKIVTSDLKEQVSEEWQEKNEQLSKLKNLTEDLKEQLNSFEKTYQTTKVKIEQKEQELEELKDKILANKLEIKKDLEELLEAQRENNIRWSEKCKERLVTILLSS